MNPPLKRKAKGVIDVTTFCFASTPPANGEIRLSDCQLPLKNAVPGYFSALHGHRNKLEAVEIARQYALEKNFLMLAVNFYLQLEHPITPGVTSSDTLSGRSFVSTTRLTRALADDVADHWKAAMMRDSSYTESGLNNLYDWSDPASFISDHPLYIADLIEKWHIPVIAHPAKFSFSERPIVVATFKPTNEIITAIEIDASSTRYVDKVINDLY